MLGKLMKQDLKKMLKVLYVFYIITIPLALIARGCSELGGKVALFKILAIIFSSLEYAVIGNILIHTFLRIVLRFKNDFYGKESYITHTIPVKKSKMLLSKYLSAMIILFSSVLLVAISLVILFYTKDGAKALIDSLAFQGGALNLSAGGFIVVLALAVLAQITAIMSICMFSVVVGHKSNQNKVKNSLFCGLICYFALMFAVLLLALLIGVITGNLQGLIGGNLTVEAFKLVLSVGICAYFAIAVLFYFLCQKQFEKGVNV